MTIAVLAAYFRYYSKKIIEYIDFLNNQGIWEQLKDLVGEQRLTILSLRQETKELKSDNREMRQWIDAYRQKALDNELQMLIAMPDLPKAITDPNRHLRPKLQRQMVEKLSMSEVETACFYLDIDFERLSGDTKDQKIISILNHVKSRQRELDLIEALNSIIEFGWGE